MSDKDYELGDRVVLMDGREPGMYHITFRHPSFEGTVTARGKDCIRVKWFEKTFLDRMRKKEEWFSLVHGRYHFSKVQEF